MQWRGLSYGHVPAVHAGFGDQGSLILMFEVDSIGKGETGEFSLGITISGQAVVELGAIFTMPDGACTIKVTEHELLEQGMGGGTYRVAANGSCTEPASPMPMFGGDDLTVGDFGLITVAAWMAM